MKFIDPHIHLFDLALGKYQWLKPEHPPFWYDKSVINNNFSEDDINNLVNITGSELNGFVHIEAGFDNNQPWREIQWLESVCKGNFKTVACIDLTLPTSDFLKRVNTLNRYMSVVGCRHILDDLASNVLTHKNILPNLKTLADHQLTFDLQMPLSDLNSVNLLSNILKKLPTLTIIINHAGSPPYFLKKQKVDKQLNTQFNNWLVGLKILSQIDNCAIKCSGWEMLDRNYSILYCDRIIKECINIFGISRVMLSSNFPLCLFSKSYQEVWQYNLNIASYDKQELKNLCFENAKYWYKF